MQCEACGGRNFDWARKCDHCGHSLAKGSGRDEGSDDLTAQTQTGPAARGDTPVQDRRKELSECLERIKSWGGLTVDLLAVSFNDKNAARLGFQAIVARARQSVSGRGLVVIRGILAHQTPGLFVAGIVCPVLETQANVRWLGDVSVDGLKGGGILKLGDQSREQFGWTTSPLSVDEFVSVQAGSGAVAMPTARAKHDQEDANSRSFFERYVSEAKSVLYFASFEASHYRSEFIEPEHVLVGLLYGKQSPERSGIIGRILARRHLSLDDVLDDVRKEIKRHTLGRENMPRTEVVRFGAETRRVLQSAADEANRLSHNYIGPEHLLLGILHESRSVAASVLIEKGILLAKVREDVVQLLSETASHGVAALPATAPMANSQTSIQYLPGPSSFWRCPHCKGAVQKNEPLAGISRYTSVSGSVTCGGCGHLFPREAIYGGKYDLPEVKLSCPHCRTQLKGPKDLLLGNACPACTKPLPAG